MKLLLYILIIFSYFHTFGQGLLNSGANIQVSSGTYLNASSGGISNQSNGTITNAGTINLDLNWTQNGASTSYSGNGWMIFKGSANQNISSVSALTVGNLKVNNANRLILGSNITISTSVDLSTNGDIQLGTNNLIMNSGATISNYNSTNYVVTNSTGRLQRNIGSTDGSLEFPVGNSSYNPVTLSNSGTTDNFLVRVEDVVNESGTSGASVTSKVVNRSWYINESVAGGSNTNLTLQWSTSEELTSFNRASSGVVHWNGAMWQPASSYTSAANAETNTWTQSRLGQISFNSPFAIENDNVLPIELISFAGSRKNDSEVILNWSAISDEKSEGFEIERMNQDESSFTKIGFVSKLSTSDITSYQFTDTNSFERKIYYRLRMLDKDGTWSYSNIITISDIDKNNNVNLYPNPVSDLAILYFQNINSEVTDATLQIFDSKGQIALNLSKPIINNIITIEEISTLKEGVYRVQIILNNGNLFNRSFVKF